MTLKKIIINSKLYQSSEDLVLMVFAKKINNRFEADSEAIVLSLTEEEAEMNMMELQNAKCPRFDYFLEMELIKEIFEDISTQEEYKSDEEKVKRIIYYAEFDA
jgi:hypothetical protein